MQPTRITLSDGLRDALLMALVDTGFYQNFARAHLQQEDDEGPPDPWKQAAALLASDLQKAISAVLIDGHGLTPDEKEEASRLCDAMTGMTSGYGTPLLQIANLPEGIEGFLVGRGLMRVAVHADNERSAYDHYSLNKQGTDFKKHVGGRMHRDGLEPGIQAIYGVDTGNPGATTAFADVDDFIDEVARFYRHSRDRVALDVPVDAPLRAEVIDLLQMPVFDMKDEDMLKGHPLLVAEPRRQPQPPPPTIETLGEARALLQRPRPPAPGSDWPKPWRFHEQVGTGVNDTFGLYDIPEGMHQLQPLLDAVNAALQSLKRRDDALVKPNELCLFNSSFLLHGCGRAVTRPVVAGKERPRHIMAMQLYQPMEQTGDHGFIEISSDAPVRGRGV